MLVADQISAWSAHQRANPHRRFNKEFFHIGVGDQFFMADAKRWNIRRHRLDAYFTTLYDLQSAHQRIGRNMIIAWKRLLAGLALSVLLACSSGQGKYASAIVSPDGSYVAVLISVTGGGFPSASCTNAVVVVPRMAVNSGVFPDSSRAYVGECHLLKMIYDHGQAALPNAPSLRWSGPRTLNIKFRAAPFYSVTSLYDGNIEIHNERQ